MYNKKGLLQGIEGCKKNISDLKRAIEKEEKRITDYETMISDLESSEEAKTLAKENINIEFESLEDLKKLSVVKK